MIKSLLFILKRMSQNEKTSVTEVFFNKYQDFNQWLSKYRPVKAVDNLLTSQESLVKTQDLELTLPALSGEGS